MTPDAARTPDGWTLGLDEAGRGSLVGPLVLGGCLVRNRDLGGLRAIGVRDSKLLSPARREEVYRALGAVGRRYSLSLPPAEVDRWVARGRLNALEAHGFARLIRRSGATAVCVDACDPVADRFGRTVAALAGTGVSVDARHRADREVPVVGAGSIVAKVRRDRAIRALARSLGASVGSGYPSDATTVEFVRRWLAERRDRPGWVRWSWRTVETLMPRVPLRTLDSEWR